MGIWLFITGLLLVLGGYAAYENHRQAKEHKDK